MKSIKTNLLKKSNISKRIYVFLSIILISATLYVFIYSEFLNNFKQISFYSFLNQPVYTDDNPINKYLHYQNVHIVNSSGVLLDRLEVYNAYISDLRINLVKQVGNSAWKDIENDKNSTVLRGRYEDNFFDILANNPSITLVVLPWLSGNVSSNMLHMGYFKWTGTDEFCRYIESKTEFKQKWDAVYNRTCNRNSKASQNASELETMYLHSKPLYLKPWPNNRSSYPYHFYHQPTLHVLYFTIIHDALVNDMGGIHSKDFGIILNTCIQSNNYPKNYLQAPLYTEVFSVPEKWASVYYHRMAELLPRIAPYITFLKKNPSIYINAPKNSRLFLEVLGLSSKRLVQGTMRAKLLYVPEGTPCGFSQLVPSQVLSHVLKQFIQHKIPHETVTSVIKKSKIQKEHFQKLNYSFDDNLSSNKSSSFSSQAVLRPSLVHSIHRNRLILIKRSGKRRFLQMESIFKAVYAFSRKYNLDFFHFIDKPSPDMYSTMLIFNSALIVVAPHGAGLVNTMYSEPGTLVVEGLCNPPKTNMCYQFLTYVLSLRYHAIVSKSGCHSHINIEPEIIIDVLNQYVNILKLKTTN